MYAANTFVNFSSLTSGRPDSCLTWLLASLAPGNTSYCANGRNDIDNKGRVTTRSRSPLAPQGMRFLLTTARRTRLS